MANPEKQAGPDHSGKKEGSGKAALPPLKGCRYVHGFFLGSGIRPCGRTGLSGGQGKRTRPSLRHLSSQILKKVVICSKPC